MELACLVTEEAQILRPSFEPYWHVWSNWLKYSFSLNPKQIVRILKEENTIPQFHTGIKYNSQNTDYPGCAVSMILYGSEIGSMSLKPPDPESRNPLFCTRLHGYDLLSTQSIGQNLVVVCNCASVTSSQDKPHFYTRRGVEATSASLGGSENSEIYPWVLVPCNLYRSK